MTPPYRWHHQNDDITGANTIFMTSPDLMPQLNSKFSGPVDSAKAKKYQDFKQRKQHLPRMAKPTRGYHVICVLLLAMLFTDSSPIPSAAATRANPSLNNHTPPFEGNIDDGGSVSDPAANAEATCDLSCDEGDKNNDDDDDDEPFIYVCVNESTTISADQEVRFGPATPAAQPQLQGQQNQPSRGESPPATESPAHASHIGGHALLPPSFHSQLVHRSYRAYGCRCPFRVAFSRGSWHGHEHAATCNCQCTGR